MVQTLEAIKGTKGSIKVGATGTISALMSRELEPTKSSLSVSTTHRKPKPRTSSDEASSSNSMSAKYHRTKQSSNQIPMLIAGDASVDGTPIRQKPVKKGPTIVEIVDIKCGNPVNPITNRLKKLGFSKLSENTGNSSPYRV